MNRFELRRKNLTASCLEKKVDGYVTFDFSDVFYLTGFPSEGCFLLASRAGDYVFSPGMLAGHLSSATREDKNLNIVSKKSLLKEMETIFKKQRLKRIGFDASKLPLSLYQEMNRSKQVSWVPMSGLILRQRMVKDAAEIACIRQACRITSEAQETCFNALRPGQTELDTSFAMEALFHKFGSPKPAFETIIAFDENASYPHHVCGEKRLEKNAAVLMDLGCAIGGYRSDLTRTDFFGTMNPKFRKIYRIVEESQKAGIAAVREGVTAGRIDFICRETIRKAGYGPYFIHGTGHGVGIDIHEPPRLGIQSKEVLKEGMIVTVEPGIYLPGEFGVRIEDTLLVKKNGCEILTQHGDGLPIR